LHCPQFRLRPVGTASVARAIERSSPGGVEEQLWEARQRRVGDDVQPGMVPLPVPAGAIFRDGARVDVCSMSARLS